MCSFGGGGGTGPGIQTTGFPYTFCLLPAAEVAGPAASLYGEERGGQCKGGNTLHALWHKNQRSSLQDVDVDAALVFHHDLVHSVLKPRRQVFHTKQNPTHPSRPMSRPTPSGKPSQVPLPSRFTPFSVLPCPLTTCPICPAKLLGLSE
jgi:hypothetical protein